ncbi:hypothetical protein HPP92_006204 [Vanilla planifolia]|uniref:Uncharacterized protein n=1 Tax=Vanilla planifolia TaxID=51239 RepID=A0A835VDW6_VANPL|nr:hypothetical protein HPP92_006204 [Vanilla planifolia]
MKTLLSERQEYYKIYTRLYRQQLGRNDRKNYVLLKCAAAATVYWALVVFVMTEV